MECTMGCVHSMLQDEESPRVTAKHPETQQKIRIRPLTADERPGGQNARVSR